MRPIVVPLITLFACTNTATERTGVTRMESSPLVSPMPGEEGPYAGTVHAVHAPAALVEVPPVEEPATSVVETSPPPANPGLPLRWRVPLPVQGIVGLTMDPVTGARYVLVDDLGLFQIRRQGPRRIATERQLIGGSGEMTGIAAMGNGQFAVTVPGVGYLYDGSTRSSGPYFCYEPGSGLWDSFETGDTFFNTSQLDGSEITYGLGYDPLLEQIVAQPYRPGQDRSFMGTWRQSTGGQPFTWTELDEDLVAGGLTVTGAGRYLLGIGSEIHALQMWDTTTTLVADLGDRGVTEITGLHLDVRTGTLLVAQTSEVMGFAYP